MMKSETATIQKLKKAIRKYNGIVAKVIEDKSLHDPQLLNEIVESMDKLIEKAEEKLAK